MTELSGKEVFSWLNDCETLCLNVQGSSMVPFLRAGDTVVLSKPEKIRKGDVVVFERNGSYIMHRVICVSGRFFDALGDNLVTPETRIPIKNIVAAATGATRKGKEISTKNILWIFYSKIYTIPRIRKITVSLRGKKHENKR